MKFLIIRFSSLGDIVLTTPLIRCIKNQHNAEVHYVTKDSFKKILKPNKFIDKLWTIKTNVSEIIGHLKKEKYTHIIDLHSNLRSLQIKLQFRKAQISTYSKGTVSKLKRIYFKTEPPNIHVVDRYFKSIAKYGVKNDGKGLDFFIPDDIVIDWNRIGLNPNQYLSFVIGAAHFTKRLPKEKILEICNRIDYPIVLIGGMDVKDVGTFIEEKSSGVINQTGQLSFMESARIIENSKGVLAHDTGFMHIASALSIPLISFWGSTDPKLGFWPYYEDAKNIQNFLAEVEGLSCRPCSKFGRADCPKGHFNCMNKQDVQTIGQKVQYMIDNESHP